MPRDGSGVYSTPPGTHGIPDTTIASTPYNLNVDDVATDLNAPRPIIAGGTGASSAQGARDNLDAERSNQVVTNFDSHVWEFGSFSSAAGATAAPTGNAFAGIAYGTDANNLVLEARDQSTGILYVRRKVSGTWQGTTPFWIVEGADQYVNVTGDTMTGALALNYAGPTVVLNKTAVAQFPGIVAQLNGANRWNIVLGNDTAESGSNSGSDFQIARYNDAGTFLGNGLLINRATGLATVAGDPTAALGIATKQYADKADLKVAKAGDTMTGQLIVTPPASTVGIVGIVSGQAAFYASGVPGPQGLIHIRPNSGQAGYLTFTEDGVADRWAIGCDAGNGELRFRALSVSGTVRAAFATTGVFTLNASQAVLPIAGTYLARRGQTGSLFVDFLGPAEVGLVIGFNGTPGTMYATAFLSNTSTVVGAITCNGSNTAYGTTSDIRLKRNLEPYTGTGEVIDALKVYYHDWIDEDAEPSIGLIAQEVQPLYPQAVTPPPADDKMPGDPGFTPWMMDYSKFVPLLLQEVKELRARVAALEQQQSTPKH